jgi:hypothetical protein
MLTWTEVLRPDTGQGRMRCPPFQRKMQNRWSGPGFREWQSQYSDIPRVYVENQKDIRWLLRKKNFSGLRLNEALKNLSNFTEKSKHMPHPFQISKSPSQNCRAWSNRPQLCVEYSGVTDSQRPIVSEKSPLRKGATVRPLSAACKRWICQ